jgi:hypothetical protein
MTIPTTDAFVRSAIRTIGYERSVAGYWAHDIMRYGRFNGISSLLSNLTCSVPEKYKHIYQLHCWSPKS